MPSTAHHTRTQGSPRTPLLRLSFTVEIKRAQRTDILMGRAARSLLAAIGAPGPVAHHMGDAATVAAYYLVRHSERPRYRLQIHSDPTGITLTVTDYTEQPATRTPTWLPALLAGQLLQAGPALPDDSKDQEMKLHRTADGHLRVAYRTLWPGP